MEYQSKLILLQKFLLTLAKDKKNTPLKLVTEKIKWTTQDAGLIKYSDLLDEELGSALDDYKSNAKVLIKSPNDKDYRLAELTANDSKKPSQTFFLTCYFSLQTKDHWRSYTRLDVGNVFEKFSF